MKNLITPAEVIEIAFSPIDQVEPAIITENRIRAAELKFIAPVLGELYPELAAEKYTAFTRKYVKPALAYFVKYNILLLLAVRIGSDGIIRMHPVDSVPADNGQISRLRREAREAANNLLDQAIQIVLKDPELFPEFDPEQIRKPLVRVNGGIIL